MTIDGTDCRIETPWIKWNGWSSHKFNKKAALRYEVGVGIQSGDIVWVAGPFPAGRYSDITIFRMFLKPLLLDGERVEADCGYDGDPKTCTPENMLRSKRRASRAAFARNRHETANGRIKIFNALGSVFRHDKEKHGFVFRAAAVIAQISIEMGDSLFSVNY